MKDRLVFFWNRLRERLWLKPLVASVLSVAGAFLAKTVDGMGLADALPQVSAETNQTLLSIMASSMLVIATFAVASMVSAYASASNNATPRSFPLIIADDVSQNALSSFIGAFIYSIVALTAVKNGYFGDAGQFVLFALTMLVFAWVVLTFVRWVDKIARLGRLANVMNRVEDAAADALCRRRRRPTLQGREQEEPPGGTPVCAKRIGYVQRIDMAQLQELAERADCRLGVAALPGKFATPEQPLLYVDGDLPEDLDADDLRKAFLVGDNRIFDEDPRFGLIVLSEIATRALSPAVNDPGTAIQIVGTLVRLLGDWGKADGDPTDPCTCDRVSVPRIATDDLLDDAFTAIARDGAAMVEVQVRLQKGLRALASLGDPDLARAAARHSAIALARAESAMQLDDDIRQVRDASVAAARDSQ